MTLIIGIKCRDGIVLGADGAATYSTPFGQQQTIRQNTVKKLTILGENLILGVAGPVGLQQAYCHEYQQYLASKNGRVPWKTILEARRHLHDSMWKHVEPLWKNAEIVGRTVGSAAALGDCNHSSVAALPVGDEPYLLQFTHQCAPEEATNHLPFLSIGSGQATADPFLAFSRRLFWPKGLPTLGEGISNVVWTLTYAINANVGITEPIQVITLIRENGMWKANELTEDDLGEHRQMITTMEDGMREVIGAKFKAPPTIPIPQKP